MDPMLQEEDSQKRGLSGLVGNLKTPFGPDGDLDLFMFGGSPSLVNSNSSSNPFSAASPANESVTTAAGTASDGTSPPASHGAANDLFMGNGWEDWKTWADYDWGDGIDQELMGATSLGGLDQIDSSVVSPPSNRGGSLFNSAAFDSPAFDFSMPLNNTFPGGLSPSTCTPSDSGDSFLSLPVAYPNASHVDANASSPRPSQLQGIPEEPSGLASDGDGSPEATGISRPSPRSRKRKSGSECEDHGSENPQHKRIQHQSTNIHSKVEKRYRMKLNDQLSDLRDCIPELVLEGINTNQSGQKVNKGTILTKAREYILKLEADKKELTEEKRAIARQLELTKRAASLVADPPFSGQARGQQRLALSKLLVAGLAGMMATEAWHTPDQGGHASGDRGLFALPTWFLRELTHSHHRLSLIPGASSSSEAFILLLRILFPFGAIIFAIRLVWSLMLDGTPKKAAKAAPLTTFRHHAFLTAVQSVWVPDGRTLEFAAIVFKILRLGLRKLGISISLGTYHSLANTPQESEAARVKAWDVALDAQLTGGDGRISNRRLFLTLLAGASLPETPYRRMLMAVHARVLAWGLNRGLHVHGQHHVQGYMNRLSRRQWEGARVLRKQQGQEGLPKHLQHLLELDVGEVLADEVVQRMWNLVWQVATPSKPSAATAADTVASDPSVRSPLDAVAAWRAVVSMQDLMVEFLASEDRGEEVRQHAEQRLDGALKVAPPGSAAFNYGLAIRAILAGRGRGQGKHAAAALRATMALPSSSAIALRLKNGVPLLDDLGGVRPAFYADLTLALRSAIALALIDGPDSQKAIDALSKHMETLTAESRLLGFVALYRFLEVGFGNKRIASKNRETLRRAAELLRRWTGQEMADRAGIGPEAADNAAELCVQVFEWHLGTDMKGGDEGYETMG